MPSTYTRVLKLPLHAPLDGGELHRIVLHLALGYHHNYDMNFPGLNNIPLLIQYGKLLALPGLFQNGVYEAKLTRAVESVYTARSLSEILGCSFHFPMQKSRVFPLDHPEILLVGLLCVATKLCFPFNSSAKSLPHVSIARGLQFNWEVWRESFELAKDETKSSGKRHNFDNVTADQVASMPDDQLDGYFEHISSLVDKRSKSKPILRSLTKAHEDLEQTIVPSPSSSR